MRRIILTGATGYIGSSIVQALLEQGVIVAIIIRPNSKLNLLSKFDDKVEQYVFNGNVEELTEFFKVFNPDIVIHVASLFIAEHQIRDIDDLLQSNIVFGTKILEAMTTAGCIRFINTGTSWQNFDDQIYNPACLYAATKQAFEDIIRFYVEATGLKALTLTIYDTYGPNDPRSKVINLFNRIAISGETLGMSGGEQEIDLIYIEDIISAYLQAIHLIEDGSYTGMKKYFLRSNNPMRLKDVAKTFTETMKKPLNINWGERPYRKREIMKTYDKGPILPGWKSKYTLSEGLSKIRTFNKKN